MYDSNGAFTGNICEKVLIGLDDLIQAGNLPQTKRTRVGLIQALNSPLNTGGVDVIPVSDNRKRKQVRIKYLQRIPLSQVSDSKSSGCTPTVFDDFNETLFDVTKYAEITWGISHDELKKVCEDPSKFIQETLMIRFNALAEKINADAWTELSANFGKNIRTGNNAATDVDVLCASTGGALPLGLQDIWQDYTEKNEYTATPIVVGQSKIARYTKTLNAGCCNDQGVDMFELSQQMGYSFFLDTMTDTYLGADEFAVLAPTMVQFVPYNLTDADSEFKVSPLSQFERIIDPVTGLEYDFTAIYNDCDREWFLKLEIQYDFFFTPNNAFNTEDNLYGTNGTLRYKANNAAC